MLLMKNFFILSGVLFALFVAVGKVFIFKNKNVMMVSNFIALIAALLGVYSILGIIIAFESNSVRFGFLMFLFAIMPFVFGQLANYHTEKYYTMLQIGLVIASVFLCKLYF